MPVTSDSLDGASIREFLAATYAWSGEKDLALETLREVVRAPGLAGYGQLKLLPFWDPLRGDAGFEAIVTSLAPKD